PSPQPTSSSGGASGVSASSAASADRGSAHASGAASRYRRRTGGQRSPSAVIARRARARPLAPRPGRGSARAGRRDPSGRPGAADRRLVPGATAWSHRERSVTMPGDARHLHTIGRRVDASQPRPRPGAGPRVTRPGGAAVAVLALVAGLALAVRVALAATAVLWFDEATAGRMAIDTLAGRFPFFLYGQTFMGAIEGYLHAVPFAALGPSSGAMRIWPVLLSLAQVGVVAGLARAILGHGRWAALVALGSSA